MSTQKTFLRFAIYGRNVLTISMSKDVGKKLTQDGANMYLQIKGGASHKLTLSTQAIGCGASYKIQYDGSYAVSVSDANRYYFTQQPANGINVARDIEFEQNENGTITVHCDNIPEAFISVDMRKIWRDNIEKRLPDVNVVLERATKLKSMFRYAVESAAEAKQMLAVYEKEMADTSAELMKIIASTKGKLTYAVVDGDIKLYMTRTVEV